MIAEAMASGLPVVTAEFAENGAKEVVSQYGAGVVCGTEPADFAEACSPPRRAGTGSRKPVLPGRVTGLGADRGHAGNPRLRSRAAKQPTDALTAGGLCMRIMITGGAGFVGKQLVGTLKGSAEVLVADLLRYGTPGWLQGEPDGFAFARVDIRDAAAIRVFDRRVPS